MAKITFITLDNERIEVEGFSGSLMKLAKANGVKGIDGECVITSYSIHYTKLYDDITRQHA